MRRSRIQWIQRAPDLLGLGEAGSATAPAHFPELAPVDEAIFLLHTAAEIEHALMAQYLYAMWSIPTGIGDSPIPVATRNRWRANLRLIAVQEMGHLLTVQNVLRAIGGPLNLDREDYPFRGDYYPFHFRLEPLSVHSLAKYVLAEMPEEPGIDLTQLRADAGTDAINRVGMLFNSLFFLVQRLEDGHFKRPRNDTFAMQGGDEWNLGGTPGLIVRTVDTRQKVLEALEEIAAQGEGTSPGEDSHFEVFRDMYAEARSLNLAGPVRNVVTNPNTAPEPLAEAEMETGRLTNPVAQAWSHLFDARYRMLLYHLLHSLHLGPEAATGRADLRNWAFEEMFGLGPIAERMMAMPAKLGGGALLAGPSFQMPYSTALPDQETDRWYGHCELFSGSALLAAKIRQVDTDPGRLALLAQIEARDQQRRAVVSARVDELQGPQPAAPDTCRRTAPVVQRQIREIRILPALAIARFGSAPEPMDNYEAVVTPAAGYRQLQPSETLEVNAATGEIARAFIPAEVRFREPGGQRRIRPVAPFLEVWARFTENGPFEPLTTADVDAQQVSWRVRAGNHKVARRTGDANDRVGADTNAFNNHDPQPLTGRAVNFRAGATVNLGSVRYIRPNAAFPEIRLRFTPAPGRVFGHRANDPNTAARVYDAARGRWDTHRDGVPGTPSSTIPGNIFARNAQDQSLGYLDDSCDGIVDVTVTRGGETFRAHARITVGPPDFAPDSFHLRNMADDIRQVASGVDVAGPLSAEEVIDVVRRGLETMRLMNTDSLNENVFPDFEPAQARHGHVIAIHTAVLRSVEGLNQPAGSPARRGAVETLRTILGRLRRFDQTISEDLAARRAMPALMRGSDGDRMALTRRQRSIIERAIAQFDAPPAGTSTPRENMLTMISALSANAFLHSSIVGDDNRPVSDLFANPEQMLTYLLSSTVRGPRAPAALLGRPLIVPGNPDASPFVQILTAPGHPMQARFAETHSATGKTRLQVVREWIASLPT
ncbi:MAG: ferritin-like domain-containing protein [Bryobacteraceae bacterium]|nr:ferritin-like domain-containing protein [Bryobacteraceae bacterium]